MVFHVKRHFYFPAKIQYHCTYMIYDKQAAGVSAHKDICDRILCVVLHDMVELVGIELQ